MKKFVHKLLFVALLYPLWSNGQPLPVSALVTTSTVSHIAVTFDKTLRKGNNDVSILKDDNSKDTGTDATTRNFTAETSLPADKTKPAISRLSPADDAVNVSTKSDLIITFDEPIVKGSGTITVTQGFFNWQWIDVNGNDVSISGNKATINLPNDFPANASVYVQFPAGVFKDKAGNACAAISNTTTWNFAIGSKDDTPPSISTYSPADNATNVVTTTNLTLTFTEDVKKGAGTIVVSKGGQNQNVDVNSDEVTISGKTVTINPMGDFPKGVAINIQMASGVLTDLNENKFAGITNAGTWNFTTENPSPTDQTPPVISSLQPSDNGINVDAKAKLVITFNENIKKGSGAITIGQGSAEKQIIDVGSASISGNTLTFNPPNDFPTGADITIQIPPGIVTDEAGNAFGGFTNATTWNFTVKSNTPPTPTPPDNTVPTIASLAPEDNAAGVSPKANLVLVFSEDVKKGNGSITITHSGGSETIGVQSASITIAGKTVTITHANDFPTGNKVFIQISTGAFTDATGNAFAGITNNTAWNFTVENYSDNLAPLLITSTVFPEFINSNAASVEIAANVNKVPAGTQAELVYRSITQSNWNRKEVISNTQRFATTLALNQFDEVGMEYYFEFTVPGSKNIVSDPGFTYINYTGSGLPISDMKFGATVENYQIISIPLNLKDKSILSTLEDNLGSYNDTQWRMFTLQNGIMAEYRRGFTGMEPGQGYWLIVRNNRTLNTGEGSTLKVYQDSPFTIQLKKGWNQIGNPYNFNVAWSDVRAYNKNPAGLGNLKVFENGFGNSETLKKFRGAFVFAANDMTISIPVLKNNNVNTRIAAAPKSNEPYAHSEWEVNFRLQSKNLSYQLGGLGMNEAAHEGKDDLDEITVPRLDQFLEMNFQHPEYFAPKFTRDIVAVAENYTWEFTVEASAEAQTVTMDWTNYLPHGLPSGKKLILYDRQTNQLIDLLTQYTYSFTLQENATFQVYYGSDDYIRQHLKPTFTELGNAFPSPFTEQTLIPFFLAGEENASVHLYLIDAMGRIITTLADGDYQPGAYQVTWNGTNTNGNRVPAGVYLYRMEIITATGKQAFVKKLVIR
jgi:methionine-rich copper-binding protein CopC